jgi:hypothetical protein
VTQMQARRIANAILASAGVAAAVVVVTRPRLRRLALEAGRRWLGGHNVAGYLIGEAQSAWAESGRAIMRP